MFSVLKELELNGVVHSARANGTVSIKCPFHSDETPSCFINTADGKFRCMSAACRVKGDFFALLCKITGKTRPVITAELSTRYNLNIERSIDPDVISRWIDALWVDQALLNQLHRRAVDDAVLRRYSIGANMDRVAIPIFTSDWIAVNAKFYRPGAPKNTAKMIGQSGRNNFNRLYPADQLSHDRLVLCGGEIKALSVISHLEGSDFGAVSTIFGEGSWSPRFNDMLRGKTVYVAMDIDEPGLVATEKLCKLLRPICDVYVVGYELDREIFPAGGIDDFIATGGDLLKCIEAAPKWKPISLPKPKPEKVATDIRGFRNVQLVGKDVQMRALVSAVDSSQYAIPGKVHVYCPKDKAYCAFCRVYTTHPPIVQLELSDATVGMLGANKAKLEGYIKEAAGIPNNCRVCNLHILEHRNAIDTRITSRVDVSSADATVDSFRCVFIDTGDIEVNSSYEMTMTMYPHPDTQQVTGLVQKVQPLEDSLASVEPEALIALPVFRCEDDYQSVLSKLAYIADAMARDVTRIFKRTDMHILADLVWHSPLLIRYASIETKGWLDACIIGDSSQGKTEFTTAIIRHYKMGTRVECKNATTAGLLGGLQQMGNRWFTVWGVLPQNDKRLVVLEELKGDTDCKVISKLTDARSSGIAQLPKIDRKIAYMRTRLLAVSNARRDIPLSGYPYGVLAIKELYGALEDVRRLDAALCVSANDVTSQDIQTLSSNPKREIPEFDSDLCKALVTWIWTRTREQVIFTEASIAECDQQALELTGKYTEIIPLVDAGSMRLKLARLSAAVAARVFSTDEAMASIIVKAGHVQAARELLDRWYSAPACGYDALSQTLKRADNIENPVEVKRALKEQRYSAHIVRGLLNSIEFNDRDMQDMSGLDRIMCADLISLLVRNRAIKRDHGKYAYVKTAPFTALLKTLVVDVKPRDLKDEF